MGCSRPLKHCLNLPSVNGGCAHWLRTYCTMIFTRGRPESQVLWNAERLGLFVIPEEWITEEEVQLWRVPRKLARCPGCRTNFFIIWEKYAQLFDWQSIVDGRHAESLFNSYNPSLFEEFKLAGEEWEKFKLDNAYVFGIPPQNAQD